MSAKRKKAATQRSKEDSRDEEKLLFKRLQRGDEIARDKIITAYSEWVMNIARKYHSYFPGIDLKELVAEGNRGMLEAMQHYDPSRLAKFSTYAWFWIIKNIQEYITSNIELIGVPAKAMAELRKIVARMNEEMKRGKNPSLEKISRQLDMDFSTVRERLSDRKNLSNPLSLDKYLDDEEREESISDLVEDKREATIQEILDNADDKENISEILGRLTPLEQKIIELRFGFNDSKFHSLKEVGKKLSLPPAKVKDIEYIAILKLKKFLSESDKLER